MILQSCSTSCGQPLWLQMHFEMPRGINFLRGLSCRTDSARIFPISRQKVAHRKTHRKTYRKMHRKMHRKTEYFHRIFSTEIFPEFSVCFSAVRTVNATEKRPPKNSARKSIAAQSKIQSANVARVEASQHVLWEAKIIPKNWKFLQLAVLHLSAFQLIL